MKSNLIFPEIFHTGTLPENWTIAGLVADGLTGWACCIAGGNPPDNFGHGMALIGKHVGVSTPKQLTDLAEQLNQQKSSSQSKIVLPSPEDKTKALVVKTYFEGNMNRPTFELSDGSIKKPYRIRIGFDIDFVWLTDDEYAIQKARIENLRT